MGGRGLLTPSLATAGCGGFHGSLPAWVLGLVGLIIGAEWSLEEQHPENLELQEKGPRCPWQPLTAAKRLGTLTG